MNLSDAARELRNKRAREYYASHKRQQAEYNRRYWERQAAKAQREAETTDSAPTPDAAATIPDRDSANGANEKVTK